MAVPPEACPSLDGTLGGPVTGLASQQTARCVLGEVCDCVPGLRPQCNQPYIRSAIDDRLTRKCENVRESQSAFGYGLPLERTKRAPASRNANGRKDLIP